MMAQGQKRKRRAASKRVTASPQKILDAFGARVLELLDNDSQNRFTIGLFWNELCRNRYAEKAKNPEIPTPGAWWHETIGARCEVRTAHRLGRIAKRFDVETLKASGEIVLDDLITWAERYHLVLPRDPSQFPIRFTTPDGQKVVKPFSQCSLKEMEWALERPKAPKPSGDDGDDGDKGPTDLQWKWLTAAADAVRGLCFGAQGENDDRGDWVWDVTQIPPEHTRQVLNKLWSTYQQFAKENGELK
jgi:hypothetical protein